MTNTIRTIQAGCTDAHVLDLWLHGKAPGTMDNYRADWAHFRQFSGREMRRVTLDDVQNWLTNLGGSNATRNRKLIAIKSLFRFATRIGYIGFNITALVPFLKVKDTLIERILPEGDVLAMIATEPDPRNKGLLSVLYHGALRVSEVVGLGWEDLREGVLTVHGKGGRTRFVKLPGHVADALEKKRCDSGPMFRSRKGGGRLTRSGAWAMVKVAMCRVGHERGSPHWLRHAHASHAMDHGAPVHLVQRTLGHASLHTTSRYVHVRPGESSGDYLAR
ncbi:MAG: tyrosine-type recombinase/integrase [Magnetococcales bacterium]|nr:tyrosine-type recombinase/integrase [Magnetococcales bacterium]MBF0110712.1 tyrosine-type recombinase/integrase [Magnetococcales bacterium]MBF0117070.1 tyrosine-type recombinase/integrase [Magnetococcales bacterium]